MIDFFEGKIHNIPSDIIPVSDRWFLGDFEELHQAVIVVEEGEFRIYTYEWNSEDDYVGEGRDFCGYIFENFTGGYRIDSLGYIKLDVDNLEDTISELNKSCKQQLDCFFIMNEKAVADFIKKHIGEIEKKVRAYAYYK